MRPRPPVARATRFQSLPPTSERKVDVVRIEGVVLVATRRGAWRSRAPHAAARELRLQVVDLLVIVGERHLLAVDENGRAPRGNAPGAPLRRSRYWFASPSQQRTWYLFLLLEDLSLVVERARGAIVDDVPLGLRCLIMADSEASPMGLHMMRCSMEPSPRTMSLANGTGAPPLMGSPSSHSTCELLSQTAVLHSVAQRWSACSSRRRR